MINYRPFPRTTFIGAAISTVLFILTYIRFGEAFLQYESIKKLEDDNRAIDAFKVHVMNEGLAGIENYRLVLSTPLKKSVGAFFSVKERDELWLLYAKSLVEKNDKSAFIRNFQSFQSLVQCMACRPDIQLEVSSDLQKDILSLAEFLHCKQEPVTTQLENDFSSLIKDLKIDEALGIRDVGTSGEVISEEEFERAFSKSWQGAKVYQEDVIQQLHSLAVASVAWAFLEEMTKNSTLFNNSERIYMFERIYVDKLLDYILKKKYQFSLAPEGISNYPIYYQWVRTRINNSSLNPSIKNWILGNAPPVQ